MEKTDESSTQIIPIVKSPSRDAHLRKGSGFSLGEINSAGINIQIVKSLGIRIDYLRKSIHEENVEKLKKIKVSDKKSKKRTPFVQKEKKKRVRAEKIKKKVKSEKKVDIVSKKPAVKAKKIPKKKIKPPSKAEKVPEVKEEALIPSEQEAVPLEKEIPKEKVIPKEKITKKEKKKTKKKEKEKIEEKITPLDTLSGLGAATVKKFMEVGVNSLEELIEEKPEELTLLISGVSEERIKKWIDEAKTLLNK